MSDTADTTANGAGTATATPQGTAAVPASPEIDMERLTEKVYRLMLADLRQEQARRGAKR